MKTKIHHELPLWWWWWCLCLAIGDSSESACSNTTLSFIHQATWRFDAYVMSTAAEKKACILHLLAWNPFRSQVSQKMRRNGKFKCFNLILQYELNKVIGFFSFFYLLYFWYDSHSNEQLCEQTFADTRISVSWEITGITTTRYST